MEKVTNNAVLIMKNCKLFIPMHKFFSRKKKEGKNI